MTYTRLEILEMSRDDLIDTGVAGIGIDTRDEYGHISTSEARENVLRHYGLTHTEINVSPYATNVLDLIGRDDLFDRNGRSVTVRQSAVGVEFIVTVDGQDNHLPDNWSASRFLNDIQVGVRS